MAPKKQSAQARRKDKVKNVLKAVSHNKWESLNEFLLAFYSSKDDAIASQVGSSLRYNGEGRRFFPEALLDVWLEVLPGA